MRLNLARLIGGLGFIAAGWGLGVAGLGLLLWAFYLYLSGTLGLTAAGVVSGVSALVTAGILFWTGRNILR